ncbi:hypothetical protein AALA13_18640 [Lachnospiraceae bacterium 50-23]
MLSDAPDINWEDILDKFSSYDGTIRDFCKENNISAHQLYYRRKRSKNNSVPVFHAVSLSEKSIDRDANKEVISSNPYSGSTIRIEIGKAKMYIPSNDKVSLSNILEAIMQSC